MEPDAGMPVTAEPSCSRAGRSEKQVSSIALEDLDVLAEKIAQGLQAHLLGALQLDMERLLREQDRRLLAMLEQMNYSTLSSLQIVHTGHSKHPTDEPVNSPRLSEVECNRLFGMLSEDPTDDDDVAAAEKMLASDSQVMRPEHKREPQVEASQPCIPHLHKTEGQQQIQPYTLNTNPVIPVPCNPNGAASEGNKMKLESLRTDASASTRRTSAASTSTSDIKEMRLIRGNEPVAEVTQPPTRGWQSAKVQDQGFDFDRELATAALPRIFDAGKPASDTQTVQPKREEERAMIAQLDARPLGFHRSISASAKSYALDAHHVVRQSQIREPSLNRSPSCTRRRHSTEVLHTTPSDPMTAIRQKRCDELLARGPRRRHWREHSVEGQEQDPNSGTEMAKPGLLQGLEARKFGSDPQPKQGEEGLPGLVQLWAQHPATLLQEQVLETKPVASNSQVMPSIPVESSKSLSTQNTRALIKSISTPSSQPSSRPQSPLPPAWMGQRVDSPLLLRLCGLIPRGRLGEAYHCMLLLLTAGALAIFASRFYRVQKHSASTGDCPAGICLHFGDLSDLVLAVGSLLGLRAGCRSTRKLLGSPADLLPTFAFEHGAVWGWSVATSWQTLYLAILWVGSLSFRAATLPSDPDLQDAARFGAFMLTSTIFMGLVLSHLHMTCLCIILVNTYPKGVSRDMDLAQGVVEWDRLIALLRKISQAADWVFMLVQTTTAIILLCSFSDLMLQGDLHIWRMISNMLLAGVLVLLLSKVAEVTEKCKRMPSLINTMDFNEGNSFSLEKHRLVEHITYSDAGFYVGEIRLTAAMALKLTYVGVLAAFGALTRLTAA